jgi:acylphosphatase
VSVGEPVARRLVVHGHVQGVFFRASARQRARDAGVRGWVRNNPDGTVEMVVEGGPEEVASVEEWVRAGGPRSARVERVEADDLPPEGYDTFAVQGH